jgi:parallel beta-helix repeat protein
MAKSSAPKLAIVLFRLVFISSSLIWLSGAAIGAQPRPGALTISFLSPGTGQEFQAPATIQLVARATVDTKKVEFYSNNLLLGVGVKLNGTDYGLTLSNVAAGTRTYEARAFDKNQRASAFVSVTVKPAIVVNVPPTISLSASPSTNLVAPASTTLLATAADSDGTIARVEFYVNDVKVFDDLIAPYTYSLSNLTAGSYTVAATAVDNKGARTTSTTIALNVLPSGGSSEIIPDSRLASWIPQVNVGVPGGIPYRTEIGATVDAAAYGNGDVDASAAIGAAIDACLPGKVVYIPEGTYRIDGTIWGPNARQITIRGAGMGRTILKANVAKMISLGDSDWPRPTGGLGIIAGADKGGTTLTLADTSSIITGNLVRIEQDDLPYVITSWEPQTNTRAMSATFRVTAKTATTVTVSPEIPFTFDRNPTLVQYVIPPLVGTGIEDITFDGNGIAGFPIGFQQAWGCWVKGIEILRSVSRQIFVFNFVNGEIRDNYIHDVIGGGPDHEGIDLYQDCSFNLIENNILYNGGFPGITLGDSRGGCVGNVIGYNFVYAANTSDPSFAGADISVSHGAHNSFNLVEGNIAGGFLSDGYFGSTSHTTVFRNWFTATHPTATDNLIAVNLGRWNNYFSFVGNVLGSSSFSFAGLYAPETIFDYNQQVIFKLGYPNLGNNYYSLTWGPTTPPDYRLQASNNNPGGLLQELDLNVKVTLIRHGNFDYLTGTTKWDPAIPNQNIPASLYYQSRPAWWPSDVAFPPIGPELSPMNGMNPAYNRFKAMNTGWPGP